MATAELENSANGEGHFAPDGISIPHGTLPPTPPEQRNERRRRTVIAMERLNHFSTQLKSPRIFDCITGSHTGQRFEFRVPIKYACVCVCRSHSDPQPVSYSSKTPPAFNGEQAFEPVVLLLQCLLCVREVASVMGPWSARYQKDSMAALTGAAQALNALTSYTRVVLPSVLFTPLTPRVRNSKSICTKSVL